MVRYGRVPKDVLDGIAERARGLRLAQNVTQRQLATRAGVGVMTVKRFEKAGQATLENVVRIALALRAEQPFHALFAPPPFASLDEALAERSPSARRRARRRP